MKVILCFLTAYRYWCNCAALQSKGKFPAPCDPISLGQLSRVAHLEDATSKLSETKELDWNSVGIRKLDRIDLLITDPQQRGFAKNVVTHLQSNFEAVYGSLVMISPGIYVCTPELCFLQMASEFGFVDLVEFGFELCGGYCLNTQAPIGFTNRIPLSSVERINQYLDRVSAVNAVKRARRALVYVANHSASPRETTFAMLETLPIRVGGYGLKLPIMNHKMELAKRDHWKRMNYYCDMYWPEHKLAVEYSGSLVHGKDSVFPDNERENIIELGGIRVLRIDSQQLSNAESLDLATRRIASYMNKHIKKPSSQVAERRENLRSYLYRWNRAPR